MQSERLSEYTVDFVAPAPPPTGILNNPGRNGIPLKKIEHIQEDMLDIDGKNKVLDRKGIPIPNVDSDNKPILTTHERPTTSEERKDASYILGQAVIKACEDFREPTLEFGDPSYSELKVESELSTIAGEYQRATEESEEALLENIEITSSDPVAASVAKETRLDGIDPGLRSIYFENQKKIESLERAGKKNLTTVQKNHLQALRTRQKQILRRSSDSTKLGKTRRFFRARKDISARNGAAIYRDGAEEDTAATLEDRGQIMPIRQYKRSKEVRNRAKGEASQTRNLVSTKGTIITVYGRRHVVADCISTPAQAHRIIGVRDTSDPFDPSKKKGDYIYEEDTQGNRVLVNMYLPRLDPETKEPIRNRSTGLVEVDLSNPIPRDDSYRSGLDKGTGKPYLAGPFYYSDGSMINSEAWGSDSFSPIDDVVILKPLLTGKEAIEAIVNGSSSGIDLSDVHIKIKEITTMVEKNPKLFEKERDRKAILKSHLVFNESDHTTPDELRPAYDRYMGTGHFERFGYTEPQTSRQTAIIEYMQLYAKERIKDSLKKGAAARQKRFK